MSQFAQQSVQGDKWVVSEDINHWIQVLQAATPSPAARSFGSQSERTANDNSPQSEATPGNTNAAIQSISDAIARLALLSPLEYEQVRLKEAERLHLRVLQLDSQVKALRKASVSSVRSAPFLPVEPWDAPVNGAELLDEIRHSLRSFVVCENETAIAATLWIAFTHFIEHVHVAPLAVITAPEMRCGKSQLLTFIGKLARNPLPTSNISSAALFRAVEAYAPTLLVDEADTFLRHSEELRGIIDSGHMRHSAFVMRTAGDDHELVRFSTWGAKAIAGINKLHPTIMDRAVVLTLRRKLPSETVERFRHAPHDAFNQMSRKLRRFAEDAGEAIAKAKPALPEDLNDRAQDNWEPLVAIADIAGGDWPALARKAAVIISGGDAEPVSSSTELLKDIRDVFTLKKMDRLHTQDLLDALLQDEESAWASFNKGKSMTARQLATQLSEYEIKSCSVRIGERSAKGYHLRQFDDAFRRYLDAPEVESKVTGSQIDAKPGSAAETGVTLDHGGDVTGQDEVTPKPAELLGCGGVKPENEESGSTVLVEF
jgi:putative DNA primase/helicase